MTVQPFSEDQWVSEAVRRYGPNSADWRFRCPICGVTTSIREWHDAGAMDSAAFACIGRFTEARRKAFGTTPDKTEGPCNYTGGGLFRLNPVHVLMKDGSEMHVFDFAAEPLITN